MYIITATQIKMKPISLYVSNGSLYKNKPKINWKVGVIKNNIPEGPNPDNNTPLTKKKRGITVIGPASVKTNDKFIDPNPKSKLPDL